MNVELKIKNKKVLGYTVKAIDIPDGVTHIGQGAFSGCAFLTHINIPDSVEFIGDCAFLCCYKLMSIEIPSHFTDEEVQKWGIHSTCKVIRR